MPKGLLEVGPEVAVHRIARLCHEAGYAPVRVVVGDALAAISRALSDTGARVVENPAWRSGRTGSVQAGLRGLEPEVDVLLWPVDHPFVEAKTLRELERAEGRDAMAVWFIPAYEQAAGHPVLWRGLVTPRVMALPSSRPLRALLPELGPQVARIPVDDPGVVENVDTPELYSRARLRFTRRTEAE